MDLDEFKGDNRYKNSFSAHGYGGQFITVIPEMRLVIAHKTNFREKQMENLPLRMFIIK